MQSTTRAARATGLAYLGIIAAGLFAELGVRAALVVGSDPVATTDRIAASAPLFAAGILADVAMVALDVSVAVGLLALLRPVHRELAQLAAALRLIQAAVIAANLMNMTQALQLSVGGPAADALGAPAAAGLVLSSMALHAVVYDLGLIFFGLSCLVLGRLLAASHLVPLPLAVGLGAAGGVYITGSCVALCAPSWSATVDPLYGVAFLAELAFALWLVVTGLRPRATT